MTIKCILVDDHTLFREGLRRLLESEADLEVVGEAGNAVEALSKIRELRPDVALMDIGMPGMSSFEAARLIEKNLPGTRIIFLTMFEDEEYLQQALNVGVAPALPTPPVGTEAAPHDYLKAARDALTAGRTGEAQQSLEMAETRELTRAVPPEDAARPDPNPAVNQIRDALHALGRGQRERALQIIDALAD